MPPESAPPAEQVFTAFELHHQTDMPVEAAPINRDWMDKAHLRHPYRCLPLVIANQNGWIMRCPVGLSVYWYGGPNKEDLEVRFDGPADNRIVSHFGSGVLTFTIPYLFRTPPGMNLWVKGPSNWIKDGIQPLEGVVEADWLASTFTMNWKVTRVCEWVRFEKGDPYCMLVPVPRGLAESLTPRRVPIGVDPELEQVYRKWEAGRKVFIEGLQTLHPETVKQGWQKDYFQGKRPDGKDFDDHQTRLTIRDFPGPTGAQIQPAS
jgi:hypothetical protein